MMPTGASTGGWELDLARLMHDLRPSWDVPGCRTAILAARRMGTPVDVIIAAVELTKRDELKTPALLATDGPHWHTGRTPSATPPRTRCTVRGHEYEVIPCRLCPVERYDPTDAPTLGTLTPAQKATNARGLAAAKDALDETRRMA